MASITEAVCEHLDDIGFTGLCADERWLEPAPGESVIVVTEIGLWASARNTADRPTVRINVYSAPSDDDDDAGALGVQVISALRDALHKPFNTRERWGSVEVLSSTQVGYSGPDPAEGHPSWRHRSITFELMTSGADLTAQAEMVAQARAEAEAELVRARDAGRPAVQEFLESGVWNEPRKQRTTWRKQFRRPAAVPEYPKKLGE